jgi:fatty-acyl-CoA synthase
MPRFPTGRPAARVGIPRTLADPDDDALHRQTLADLLRRTAARWPHKTGIVCGEHRWTWPSSTPWSTAWPPACMRRRRAGERVGVLARNSHGFAALRFALARLGAVMVPVNFMLNADEAAYILRHAGVKLLATDSGLAALGRAAAPAPRHGHRALPVAALGGRRTSPSRATGMDLRRRCWPPPTAPARQIIYTSGTESLPKGAMLTHEAVIAST